jgi:hypothetical protein
MIESLVYLLLESLLKCIANEVPCRHTTAKKPDTRITVAKSKTVQLGKETAITTTRTAKEADHERDHEQDIEKQTRKSIIRNYK